jgi:hypothetical protein
MGEIVSFAFLEGWSKGMVNITMGEGGEGHGLEETCSVRILRGV